MVPCTGRAAQYRRITPTTTPWIWQSSTMIGSKSGFAGCRRMRPSRSLKNVLSVVSPFGSRATTRSPFLATLRLSTMT